MNITEKFTPKISFCIPTYNRDQLLKECLSSILDYKGEDIEIVVGDNNSPDNTHEIIKSISDNRIKYFKNEKNLGAVPNIIRTFQEANGEWIFTLSDEDKVTPEIIKKIISVIKENAEDCSVILGNVRNSDGPYPYYVYHNGWRYVPYKWENSVYAAGDNALLNTGFLHRYMSGILVRKEHLSNNIMESFDSTKHGVAPHTVLYTIATQYGDVRTCDIDFCYKRTQKASKSFVENIGKKNYRHPDNKFVAFEYYSKLTDSMMLDSEKKIQLISKLYGYFLDLCTYDWHKTLSKQSEKDYFDIQTRESVDINYLIESFNKKTISLIESLNLSKAVRGKLYSLNEEKFLFFYKRRKIKSIQ